MDDKETIYVSALRYALGRRTYITSLTADFINEQDLSGYCIQIMIDEIDRCQDLGMDTDRKTWQDLKESLEQKLAMFNEK